MNTEARERWLVGHDLTPIADRVAFRAAEECVLHGASLLLFHAFPIPTPPPIYAGAALSAPTPPVDLSADVARMAQMRLDLLATRLKERFPSLEVEVRVQMGHAGHELLVAADDAQVSRIVVGTHGRTGLRHFFLGSVAEQVVRLSRVPVLVHRAEDDSDLSDERRSVPATPGAASSAAAGGEAA